MAILALGGALASLSVGLTASSTIVGLGVAFIAFTLIGVGVGAAGTSLLIFLASHVEREKRAAAATIVWIMMIVGFILTSAFVGHFLDPFTPLRLVSLASAICGIAFLISLIALYRLEPHQKLKTVASPTDGAAKPEFREAFSHVWRMVEARRFAIFVFISMLAYSAQDLILEPFAALRFGLTPGQTASLSGMQNGGVLMGMILVGVLALQPQSIHGITQLGHAGMFWIISRIDWSCRRCAYGPALANFGIGFCFGLCQWRLCGGGHWIDVFIGARRWCRA
jgi:BCD family chlorophyll transporter-like MFS transporter